MLIHLPSVDCCYLPNLRQQWGKEKREKRRKWWWNTIKTRTTQSAFNNNNNSLLWITTDRYVSVQRCGLSCYCYYDFSFNSQVHAGALSISTWSRVKKIKQQSCERVFFSDRSRLVSSQKLYSKSCETVIETRGLLPARMWHAQTQKR